MKDWFCLNLGDGVQAFEPSHRIMDAYANAYVASGAPTDMAVFTQHDQGEKRNLIFVYFTPSASLLAQAFGAVSCEKPSSDGISLLVGDVRAWDIHFPDHVPRHQREL